MAAKQEGHEIKVSFSGLFLVANILKSCLQGKKNITVKKADVKQGKIYVGKLPDSGVGEDEIREHFSQFGTIAEVSFLLYHFSLLNIFNNAGHTSHRQIQGQ